MIRGLLFDLDGVLVDTAKYHFLAWQRMASALGIPFGHKENEQLKGVSRRESLERILAWGKLTLPEPEMQHWMDLKNQWYLEYVEHMDPQEVLPGVRSFLSDARAQGYLIGLGSASKNAIPLLKKVDLFSYFDAIVDGHVVTESKPHPAVFLEGAKLLALLPEQCVVFEDAVAGVEAAKRGGMRCIGMGRQEELPLADKVISGFENQTVSGLLAGLSLL